MRRAFIYSGLAATAGILAGCGGSGGGSNHVSSKIAVGYVYVATNSAPAGSPGTIVTSSATAPNGYEAPTAGTLTLHVNNGTITRASADENFDMAVDGNAIVARVTSKSSGIPALSFSGTGFEDNGTSKPNIPTQTVDMTGVNNTIFPINYQSPNYTPGAVAAVKILVRDPNGLDKFGAPGDIIPVIIPSLSSNDDYDLLTIPLDANNVVIPTAPAATVTDPNSNSTENAVSEASGEIAVAGGGVEGTNVTITATISGVSASFTTQYSYGTASSYSATFAPSGSTILAWPISGPAATQAFNVSVVNTHGVPVPNLAITFTRGDANSTGTSAASADPYPGPGGNAIALADPTTSIAGAASVTFQTPIGAAGDPTFNSLAIKGTDHLQIRAGSSSGVVFGFTNVIITRPLSSLTIVGPTRLDVNTQSKPVFNTNIAYQVTGAIDVDTLSLPSPAGPFVWALAPLGNGGPNFVGDPDNQSLRGVSAPTISGSATGSSIIVNAGGNAGQFGVTATFGVSSNVVTTDVWGPPSKVILSPTPAGPTPTGGYTGAAGSTQAIALSYEDAFGHNVSGETTVTGKSGSVSSSGASLTFPNLPSLSYNAVLPNASGTAVATMTTNGTWLGTGQGTSVGSATWNLSRNVNLIVP